MSASANSNGPPEVPPTASPLWPVVLALAEIAERVSREQAQEMSAATAAESPAPSLKKP